MPHGKSKIFNSEEKGNFNRNTMYDTFVLVDDNGKLLANGKPSEGLPPLRERQMNYNIVSGSKYSREADRLASNVHVASE